MGDCTRVHFRPQLSLRLDKPVFHPDKFSLSFSHQVGKQNRILNGRGGRLDSCSCHYYPKCICFGGKRQNRGKRCNALTTGNLAPSCVFSRHVGKNNRILHGQGCNCTCEKEKRQNRGKPCNVLTTIMMTSAKFGT